MKPAWVRALVIASALSALPGCPPGADDRTAATSAPVVAADGAAIAEAYPLSFDICAANHLMRDRTA